MVRRWYPWNFSSACLTGNGPHELRHWLGPESNLDVLTRVIGFERDAIIARNIREIQTESVENAPDGLNGPLVLAAVGKAHVQGVAHHLKLPLSELHEIIADFSEDRTCHEALEMELFVRNELRWRERNELRQKMMQNQGDRLNRKHGHPIPVG